jgi:hypothetical protein
MMARMLKIVKKKNKIKIGRTLKYHPSLKKVSIEISAQPQPSSKKKS